MNDLISRQAAIDGLNKIPDLGVYEYCSFLYMLKSMPSAQEWFMADEARKRLVIGSRVLACVGADKSVMMLQYIGNGQFWAAPGAAYSSCEINAWMPLPEPPKEEEGE